MASGKDPPEFQGLFVLQFHTPAFSKTKCSCCGGTLQAGVTFCVKCGTDLKTGKKMGESETGKDIPITFEDEKDLLTFQLIADGWRAIRRRGWLAVVGVFLLMWIISLIGGGIGSTIPVFGWAVPFVVSASLAVGWNAFVLKTVRGEKSPLPVLFEGFKKEYILKALGALVLMKLLIGLGFLGLIIVGVFLTIAYSLTWFFLYDKMENPWKSMTSSFDATKGFRWRIMAVWTICGIIGTLCVGIGLLVTMPLAYIATASLYHRVENDAISEKHRMTQISEYLIALIPTLILIVILVIVAIVVLKRLPGLS